MPTVEKFSQAMLEKYVKARGWKYLRDGDGDFRVDFAYDDSTGCELTLWLIADGRQKEIFYVRVASDKRIPKTDWARAMMICNTWNKDRRWPKAYLNVRNPDTDTTATIALEQHLDCEKGIHQELLEDFANTIWATSISFWEWAHKEQGL